MSEPASAGADARDPSMAEILASIQRILSENEPEDRSSRPAPPRAAEPAAASHLPAYDPPPSPAAISSANEAHDDVLVLEKSMMVAEDAAMAEAPYKSPLLEAATSRDMSPITAQPVSHMMPHPFPLHDEPEPAAERDPPAPPPYDPPPVAPPAPRPIAMAAPNHAEKNNGLLAADTAALASHAIGNLVRTIAAERVVPVQRGGLTIEDVVREELRPLLKSWLDTHLPPLVEKLVQVEIERVVNRATS
jgi:cell pole-organizing protein PopZ